MKFGSVFLVKRLPDFVDMILNRLANSTVVWSWIVTGLRMASGLILLPLILRQFTPADLGMYFVLLSLGALAPIIDMGFGQTIDRFISYAMGGAESVEAHGVPKPAKLSGPNYSLLWHLLFTTRILYRYLSLLLLVVLGVWGTYSMELKIGETSSPLLTRLAWGATLFSMLADIYSNWWLIFLRGLNEVRTAARVGVVAAAAQLVLAALLLISGAGLLSLPLAGMASGFIQRHFARRRCLALLGNAPPPDSLERAKIFRALWPNSWRLGVQIMSVYLTTNANITICQDKFGLPATGKYGLSIRLMGIASGMAYVWTITKWPLIGQHRARHDQQMIQRILRPRMWLQVLTLVGLAGAVVFIGPPLLRWVGSDKEMLPMNWMLLLMLGALLDSQFVFWTTLIATENRVPSLWPTVATNCFSLILTLYLVNFTSLGLGALVLGPLVAGCVFNYWFWPFYGARGLGTTLFRFLFWSGRQAKALTN